MFIPEAELPAWVVCYVPATMSFLSILPAPRSFPFIVPYLLFENTMSVTKFSAMISGLFQLGSAYEWVVTKKSGRSSEGDLFSLVKKEPKQQRVASVPDLETVAKVESQLKKESKQKHNRIYRKELALAFLLLTASLRSLLSAQGLGEPEESSSGASSGPPSPVDTRVLRDLDVMKAGHDLDTTVTEGSLAAIRERCSIPTEYGLHVLRSRQRPYGSEAPGIDDLARRHKKVKILSRRHKSRHGEGGSRSHSKGKEPIVPIEEPETLVESAEEDASPKLLKEARVRTRKMDDELLQSMKALESTRVELPRQAVDDYKESAGFKEGLKRMSRVTYEYGYRVALARFRSLHPDSEVEEDPFAIRPEDDSVPIERQQAFDDSDPPES
ncbi:hypothetical protein B296_00024894 [Ensete ventricosum]|uniref:Uncharacterized protein n=1 Tax=Ensete ventricosum TaxID=4639 RepID=A0A426Z9J3_ENSVE|nr:hypothetical protein B296_00024894 [Ensete ventricosum]